MAQLLNQVVSFVPTAAIDVVAVYNQDYQQVFPKARPIKASVRPDSKLMEHPLETGATVVDHRIILPVEIELSLILPSLSYRDTYEQIKQLFLNGDLLIVQTRSDTYLNQCIMSLPHDEDPEMYDTLVVALKLKEVQFVVSQYEPVPKNPVNKSTQKRGNIQTTPANAAQTEKSSFGYDKIYKK